MDIVRKIKPLKATFESLSIRYKAGLIVVLVSLVSSLIPQPVYAFSKAEHHNSGMIFVAGDYAEYINEIKSEAEANYYKAILEKNLHKKLALSLKLKEYLNGYNSPLAEYTDGIIELKNWKKIIALSNAESSLCRRYPESTANCWGVGGANLWDMGDNLGEGVKEMDHFLRHYPRRNTIKYDAMKFEHMNGLYKQPAADHWVINNQQTYNDLIRIEQEVEAQFN